MMVTRSIVILAAASWLAGCSSFGEGVARGVLARSDEPTEDTRMCEVSGPAFTGILPMLESQDGYPPIGEAGPDRPILKVIMVHGVGTHVPGYSARLSANLARSLGLTVVAPEAKGFPIESPAFPGETLGMITVTRHTNAARDREMLFFELTWSPISQPAKDAIAFDNTAVYAHRRAAANNVFKQFVNDVAPDPLVYTGTGRERIQVTIGQTLCWASAPTGRDCPTSSGSARRTRRRSPRGSTPTSSRSSPTAWAAGSPPTACSAWPRPSRRKASTSPEVARVSEAFQDRDVKVFMLANQLPLLQSGLEPVSVQGAVPAFCQPDGAQFANRAFSETEIIAFSDPNDLLSYPIPDAFVRDHVDSRLCPKQVNVTINIAPVRSVLGPRRVRQPARGAQRLRRRRAGDRADHARHRPAGDRRGGGGALHLDRGRRGPALTRGAPGQLARPMPRRIASCLSAGRRSIAAKPRPRSSLAGARSVENSRFMPSVMPAVSQASVRRRRS